MSDTHDFLAQEDCRSRVQPADKNPRRSASRKRCRQIIPEPKPETEQRKSSREGYTLPDGKFRTETRSESNNQSPPKKPRGDLSEWLRYVSLDPRNSDRHVAARWQIALLIADGTKLPRSYSDEWVQRAVRYLRACNSYPKEIDTLYQLREMSDVDEAFWLSCSSDPLARGEVEARLLGGQTIKEVAAACNLTEETVAAYHALFFNVMDKLKAPFYIHTHAIGFLSCEMVPEEAVDVILKRAGYIQGPIFLECFLRYYRTELKIPTQLAGLSREQLEDLHILLIVRALILLWVLPAAEMPRILLVQELLLELKRLLDAWPPTEADGPKPGHVVWSFSPASREAWWANWRRAMETVSNGGERELGCPEDTQVA